MNKLNKYFYISKLISRKVNKTISKEELDVLSEWLDDEENKGLYDKLSNKDNFERWERDISQKDSEIAWKNFERAIEQERRKSLSFRSLLKYAAIFLLPLILLASLLSYLSNVDLVKDTADLTIVDIEAEALKPKLILDNGKKLILDDENLTSIEEKDGTKIKNENGKLSYNDSGLKTQQKILYHTVVIPMGSEYEVILGDGSKVVLNALSSLKYPVQFSNTSREVELKGEGYFEVAKDLKRPFIVKVDGMKVNVLGTKFNVKAYDNDNKIVTTLVSGSVEVEANSQSEEPYKLLPNEQLSLNKEDKNISIEKVDVFPFIAWKDGLLVFKEERLDDIMKSLMRWYDIDVTFLSPEIKDMKFGGSFKRDGDLHLISKMLTYTNKVDCKVNGNKLLLNKKEN